MVLGGRVGVTTVVDGPAGGFDPADNWTSRGRGTRAELSEVSAAETDANVSTMAAIPGIAHQGDFIVACRLGGGRP